MSDFILPPTPTPTEVKELVRVWSEHRSAWTESCDHFNAQKALGVHYLDVYKQPEHARLKAIEGQKREAADTHVAALFEKYPWLDMRHRVAFDGIEDDAVREIVKKDYLEHARDEWVKGVASADIGILREVIRKGEVHARVPDSGWVAEVTSGKPWRVTRTSHGGKRVYGVSDGAEARIDTYRHGYIVITEEQGQRLLSLRKEMLGVIGTATSAIEAVITQ